MMAKLVRAAVVTSLTGMEWKTGSSPGPPPWAAIWPLIACSTASKPGWPASEPFDP